MPSIKQIQNRLLNGKNSLNKVNLNMADAERSKNKIMLRKLNQEKATLDRDISKLKRQLVMEQDASKERKKFNPSQDYMEHDCI
jgi:hypothetical protein